MTVCDRREGGGVKIIKKSVTYFMDGPCGIEKIVREENESNEQRWCGRASKVQELESRKICQKF